MAEAEEEETLLGRIAVRHRYINLDQLAEATRESGRIGKRIGAVLVDKGMISKLELAKILALQQRHFDNITSRTPAPVISKPRIQTPTDWVARKQARQQPETAPKKAPPRDARTTARRPPQRRPDWSRRCGT